MGQVTIYLDNETEKKLKSAARASNLSVSKWIAGIVREKIASEWPNDVMELAGSWKDEDFPSIEEIRASLGNDAERETF